MFQYFRGLVRWRFWVLAIVVLSVTGTIYRYRHSFQYKKHRTSYEASIDGRVEFFDRWRTNTENWLLIQTYAENPECQIRNYEGELIYKFPMGFCAFTKSGRVYLVSDQVVAFDSQGFKEWESHFYDQHHHVTYSEEDKALFFISGERTSGQQQRRRNYDIIYGLDDNGKQIFEWRTRDHIDQFRELMSWPGGESGEYTHFNSVEVLKENPVSRVIPAFKAGNLIVNCYMQGLLFIIDRQTHKIVWHYIFNKGDVWQGVHTPTVLENGHLFYFWNKRKELDHNFSTVNEYDPVEKKMLWEYRAPNTWEFFSRSWGAAYPIGSEQFIATLTATRVALQMDRSGRILWEWHEPENELHAPDRLYRVKPIRKSEVEKIIRVWSALQPTSSKN